MRPLRDLLEEHLAADFPAEIEKGEFYGSIDPVMIGADIFGWVSNYASGSPLDDAARAGLEQARLDLRKYPPGGGTYEAPWSSLDSDDMTSNLRAARESLTAALESELSEYPWVLITYRNAMRAGADLLESDLTNGEIELLIGGLTDDISFDIAMINLGIRGNPPDRSGPPGRNQVEAAFRSYERLINSGLIQLGRVQYIDAGPPGRVAPVEHVEEPFLDVRRRVDEACRTASDWGDWAFSCWTVNTEAGDAVASRELARR